MRTTTKMIGFVFALLTLSLSSAAFASEAMVDSASFMRDRYNIELGGDLAKMKCKADAPVMPSDANRFGSVCWNEEITSYYGVILMKPEKDVEAAKQWRFKLIGAKGTVKGSECLEKQNVSLGGGIQGYVEECKLTVDFFVNGSSVRTFSVAFLVFTKPVGAENTPVRFVVHLSQGRGNQYINAGEKIKGWTSEIKPAQKPERTASATQ